MLVVVGSDVGVRLKDLSGRRCSGSERHELVAALACVDYVIVFDEKTVEAVLRALRQMCMPRTKIPGRVGTGSGAGAFAGWRGAHRRRPGEDLATDMIRVGVIAPYFDGVACRLARRRFTWLPPWRQRLEAPFAAFDCPA